MTNLQIKTLSLLYHPKEDRMILLINKDANDKVSFWITRRFYLTFLFQFDIYLENFGLKEKVEPPSYMQAKKQNATGTSTHESKHAAQTKDEVTKEKNSIADFIEPTTLLENISLTLSEDKETINLIFKAGTRISQALMNKSDLLSFYTLAKKSFPRREWGIV